MVLSLGSHHQQDSLSCNHQKHPQTIMGSLSLSEMGHKLNLDEPAKLEVKQGLTFWQSDPTNASPATVTKASFPLPTLGPRLEELAKSIHATDGDCFAVISGLDTAEFTTEENMIVYLGICAHIGSERGTLSNIQS